MLRVGQILTSGLCEHIDDGVWHGEDASLAVESLARIGAGVFETSVVDGEHALAVLVRDRASRLLAHVAPVETPVDEGRRKTARLAFHANRATQVDRHVADRSANYRWLL